jgi:TolB protein
VTFEGEYNDGGNWNPDGTRLTYATRVDRSRFDIALVDLVSLAARRLTSGGGTNEGPSFSPDGRRIVFCSSRAGGMQVFAMAADGSGVEQLTFSGSSWSPDWSGYLR